jgi:hypothetical protein
MLYYRKALYGTNVENGTPWTATNRIKKGALETQTAVNCLLLFIEIAICGCSKNADCIDITHNTTYWTAHSTRHVWDCGLFHSSALLLNFAAFCKIRFVSCRMCSYTAAVYSAIQKVQLHCSCIQCDTESAVTLQLYTALYRKCSYTAAV